MLKLNWGKAGTELSKTILDEVQDLIDSGVIKENSRLNIQVASRAYLEAVANGQDERADLALKQIRASLEVARIEEADQVKERLDKVLDIAKKILTGLAKAALVLCFLLVSGCGLFEAGGNIKASEVDGLWTDVLDRYDAYVVADESLDEPDAPLKEEDLLLSSKILRDVLDAAKENDD